MRTNSVADAWAGFLVELQAASGSVHDVIERRGRLAEFRGEQATIKLANLLEDERLIIGSKHNQRTCSKAFSKALGREITVLFEDTDTSRPGAEDLFTQEVRDLFQGRIED